MRAEQIVAKSEAAILDESIVSRAFGPVERDDSGDQRKRRLSKETQTGALLAVKYLKKGLKLKMSDEVEAPLYFTNQEAINAARALLTANEAQKSDITLESLELASLIVQVVFNKIGDLIPDDRGKELMTSINYAIVHYSATKKSI